MRTMVQRQSCVIDTTHIISLIAVYPPVYSTQFTFLYKIVINVEVHWWISKYHLQLANNDLMDSSGRNYLDYEDYGGKVVLCDRRNPHNQSNCIICCVSTSVLYLVHICTKYVVITMEFHWLISRYHLQLANNDLMEVVAVINSIMRTMVGRQSCATDKILHNCICYASTYAFYLVHISTKQLPISMWNSTC